MKPTDFLASIRQMIKYHESMLKDICEDYQLSLIEANIISFLYNNPGKDTAGDIVELRMLSKGNVSKAVEELIQKSLLSRTPDTADRRKIHLALRPEARPITDRIKKMKQEYDREIFQGLSEEEIRQFYALSQRIKENAQEAMKRREKK
ncbi:MAG TPA: MarR family transcriptional regulator [Candidatus Blautia gallistercoris]|uniref:MarR family transcriptional regulator n=1 Tax=Candidatus Blautia gallistercoris TaxID=2838490 RepID=A0A9D1WFM0_9FIRM|nr:MarR family transcriptional regulator [Candidatus Blautia gallistercoris]